MYGLNWDSAAEQAQPKYKVGQLVRVVKLGSVPEGSAHGAEVGSIDTVTEVFGDGGFKGKKWGYYLHEIQPAFLPGDRVRVTKHSGYFAAGDTGEVDHQTDAAVFVKHGSYQRIGLPIDADALELIAEPEAGNKGQHKIELPPETSLDAIWINGRLYSTEAHGIELWPSPCIVARVLDGTPRPSNVPFVHATVASATVEAERLAKNNPGQEFAVYQRVAGRVAEVSYEMKEVA